MVKIIVLILAVILTGCSTYSTGRYTISADNAVALRSLSGTYLNVGDFTDNENLSGISCHGHGDVLTPEGETFAKFIQKAFLDELKMAGIYSKLAPVTIAGKLDYIDYSSVSGVWELALTMNASTGESVVIKENYNFSPGSDFGTPGGPCAQVALAFVPAVQNLIGKIIEQLPVTLLKAKK